MLASRYKHPKDPSRSEQIWLCGVAMNAPQEYPHLATCFRSAKKILRIIIHLPPKMPTLRMTKMGAVKRVAEDVVPYEIKGRAVGEGLAPPAFENCYRLRSKKQ